MIKVLLLIAFTIFTHSAYSQPGAGRNIDQKLIFKQSANFDSLTASTVLTLDGSKDVVSSNVTVTNLAFIDNLLALDAGGSGIVAFNDSTDAFSGVTITGTANQITITNGNAVSGAPTISITDNPTIGGTEAILVPTGTTAQRPTGTAGQIRYNTTTGAFEGYTSAWGALGTGTFSIPSGTNDVFVSWRIAGSDGTVSSEYGNPIDGNCTRSSTGDYSCTFLTAWASAPNCNVNCFGVSSRCAIGIETMTTATFAINVRNLSDADVDRDTVVTCSGSL